MKSSQAVALAAALLATTMAGCIGSDDGDDTTDGTGLVPVTERHLQPYDVESDYSHVLAEPLYDILDPQGVFVDVDLPIEEGGAAILAPEGPQVHLGLWLPDVPEGTLVPVIADVGPYYDDLDVPATEPANRLGGFLIENFVPQGYAVAQVSVFGSGESNHCMDLMGRAEQMGVQAAVEWLGTQDWSNGNVGLIGRSYDGSTPYEAAMIGDEYLKTIVPISGLIGQQELMWKNGSTEFRGPIMHNVVYGFFGIDSVSAGLFGTPTVNDPDPGDAQTVCPDYATGPAHGGSSYALGGEQAEAYWAERSFLDDVLANYKGSVYLIHGMQDWNVDPHMAFPVYQQLEAAGLEVRGLFGQWAHNYPDRVAEHDNCDGRTRCYSPHSVRPDWAQDLLEWFDHYLKETGPKPALHVQVQDNQGAWRIEETYPPRDRDWLDIPLSHNAEGVSGQHPIAQAGGGLIGPAGPSITLDMGVLSEDEDVRFAGLAQLPLTVTPTGPGGQIFAELRDATDDRHIGHAIMDLRYYEGGDELQEVVAGQPIVAKMEFFAADVVVPAGHRLHLRLASSGEDYLPPSTQDPVLVHISEESMLRLPTIQDEGRTFFTPPRNPALFI